MISNFLFKNKNFIVYALLCMLVVWGYELYNYSVSIDDELHFFDSVSSLVRHNTRQGRWGGGLLNFIFGNSCGVPVVYMFISFACLFGSFCLLGKCMKFEKQDYYLFFPIFIACPIWYYLFLFWMVSPNVGVDMFLVSIAATWVLSCRDWRMKGCAVLFCSIAIGSYEISILLLPLFYCAGLLSEILNEENRGGNFETKGKVVSKYVTLALWIMAVILISVVFYVAIGKLIRWIFDMKLVYTSKMFAPPTSFADCGERIKEYGEVLVKYYKGAWYPPRPVEPAHRYLHVALVVMTFLLVTIRIFRVRYWKQKILCLLALIFVAGSPFLIKFFVIYLPPRSLVILAFSLVILFCLAYRALQHHQILKFIYVALVCIVGIQYATILNRMAFVSKLRSDKDHDLMVKVIDRLERCDRFFKYAYHNRSRRCQLFVVGAPGNHGYQYPFFSNDVLGRSILDWQGGDPIRFATLARLISGYEFVLPSRDMSAKVMSIAELMPCWPMDGSVKFTNDVAIVKFAQSLSEVQKSYYKIKDNRRFHFPPNVQGIAETKFIDDRGQRRPIWTFSDDAINKVADGRYLGGNTFKSTGNDFRFYVHKIPVTESKSYVVNLNYEVSSPKNVSARSEIFYLDNSIDWNHGIGEISYLRNKRGGNSFALVLPGSIIKRGLRFDLSERGGETIKLKCLEVFEVE